MNISNLPNNMQPRMRAMLDAAPGYEVIGEAATGEAAVAMTAELKPDVVLMDLRHRHSSAPEKPS